MIKSEHAIVHRGYTIVPVDFRDDDWVPVPSAQATGFEIYPPGEDTPRLDAQIDAYDEAIAAIEGDLMRKLNQTNANDAMGTNPCTILYRGCKIEPISNFEGSMEVVSSSDADFFVVIEPSKDGGNEGHFTDSLESAFAIADKCPANVAIETHPTKDEGLTTARYTVIVTRDTTESTVITVDAVDEDEAEEKAIALSHQGDHNWEQDCTPNASKEHYTNGAELV